ncbi:MAG: M20/M25/M40 family metallo-hydrolase [Chloroflexi bacterium]|nr:M20/M25/M40 family metallo-hydrolase [Chloroflexota bacterium]
MDAVPRTDKTAGSEVLSGTAQRVLETFLELARIDSPPRKEGAIMRLLAGHLEAIGCDVVFDRAGETVGGETGNLIATLPGASANAVPIFLSAHVDTVAPTAGINIIVEDGVVRTDGNTILGADDKAAVAAILEAARHVVTHRIPHGPVQILLSICEEVGLLGARHMDRSLVSGEMGFVFDSGQPVGGIVVHSPTHDRIRAVVTGRKAHAGAAPEQGVSAIQAAAAGISRMKLGRIDAETTANIGVIQGGEATNVVPDRVEILAEARSRNEGKLKVQVEHMLECLREGAAQYGASVEIETHRYYSTFKWEENEPVVQTARRAVLAAGLEPALCVGGGGSDASIFNEQGLPSVVLGIGYQNIHTHAESITVRDLIRTHDVALALMTQANSK